MDCGERGERADNEQDNRGERAVGQAGENFNRAHYFPPVVFAEMNLASSMAGIRRVRGPKAMEGMRPDKTHSRAVS